MIRRLYLGESKGLTAFKTALKEVRKLDTGISEDTPHFTPMGEIVYLGFNEQQQPVYWLAAGESSKILKQAIADFLPMLNDCISNWDVIETPEEE